MSNAADQKLFVTTPIYYVNALHCDGVAQKFRAVWSEAGISNDGFISTTSARHKASDYEMWRRMFDAGDIYLGEYDGHLGRLRPQIALGTGRPADIKANDSRRQCNHRKGPHHGSWRRTASGLCKQVD